MALRAAFILLTLTGSMVFATASLPLVAPKMITDVATGSSVAVDSHGNLIVGTSKEGFQGVVRKYDTNGAIVWERFFNSWRGQEIAYVGVDYSDSILAAGGLGDVRKYSSAGALIWETTAPGSTGGNIVRALAVGGAGEVYVVSDLGPGLLVSKLLPDGTGLWGTVATSVQFATRAMAVSEMGTVRLLAVSSG